MTSTTTLTTVSMTSTTTLFTVTMTTTPTDTTITTTTPLGATTTITVTTQTSTTTRIYIVAGSMWFESTGTQEQVESASVNALASHFGVPESAVFCVASLFTNSSRRLMSDRELTSSVTHWQVDWTIVASASPAFSAYDVTTELHQHVNATSGENLESIETFYSLMELAMSSRGLTLVSNSSVFVHAEPTIMEITVTQTTSTTATPFAEGLIADTEKTASIDFVIMGIIVGAIFVLCCCIQLLCFLRIRRQRKSEEDLEAVSRNDLEQGTPEDIIWVAPGAPPRIESQSNAPKQARSLSRGARGASAKASLGSEIGASQRSSLSSTGMRSGRSGGNLSPSPSAASARSGDAGLARSWSRASGLSI
ncbi:unnamed protein product [Prorocentrum cordatum]|uniref:Uncharacterized protein n=1 Tax=Prorocentrum cordatum TaxID=2364126 RepID=A0ABN9UGT6_9DINO|nr:unnamed protein product [Polarella glacialis]